MQVRHSSHLSDPGKTPRGRCGAAPGRAFRIMPGTFLTLNHRARDLPRGHRRLWGAKGKHPTGHPGRLCPIASYVPCLQGHSNSSSAYCLRNRLYHRPSISLCNRQGPARCTFSYTWHRILPRYGNHGSLGATISRSSIAAHLPFRRQRPDLHFHSRQKPCRGNGLCRAFLLQLRTKRNLTKQIKKLQ